MTDGIARRRLGRSALEVNTIGMGCAPLGELFVRVDDAAAQATLQAAWDGGVRYFDTAPEYGFGLSEHRVGQFLRQRPRNEFVLSTKVGRLLQAPPDVSKYRKQRQCSGACDRICARRGRRGSVEVFRVWCSMYLPWPE